jgi:hypothetical protein
MNCETHRTNSSNDLNIITFYTSFQLNNFPCSKVTYISRTRTQYISFCQKITKQSEKKNTTNFCILYVWGPRAARSAAALLTPLTLYAWYNDSAYWEHTAAV